MTREFTGLNPRQAGACTTKAQGFSPGRIGAIIFGLLLCLAIAPAQAQSIGAQFFGPAVGHNATVTFGMSSVDVVFQAAEWPNASWSAGAGKSWDWRGHATLAFNAANPGPDVVDFNVRIDDDLKADGVHHCHTAAASLGAGQSGTFFVDLSTPDSKATMGMNGGPPPPGRAGMTAMSGSGEVDPSHIVAFQVFLHQPATPRTLRLSRLRLLPTNPGGRSLHRHRRPLRPVHPRGLARQAALGRRS